MEAISHKQLVALMQKRQGKESLTKFARSLRPKVSFQFLGKVYRGEYHAGDKLAKQFGFKQTVVYVPLPKKPKAKAKKAAAAK